MNYSEEGGLVTQELRNDYSSQGLGCSLGHVTSVDAVPPRTLSQNLENERFDPHHLKDHVSLSFLSSEALIITL